VVHHGVTVAPADPETIAAARASIGVGDAPYVLWVGALEPRKNVGVLVEAFGRLVAAHPATAHRLVLVGPRGWLNAADAVAQAAEDLGERVVMPGPVPAATLRGLFAGASVFAFPSIHEGFGIPVLEAMAQGTPVIASDIPPLVEVGGDVARYVAPDDPEAWADALEEALAAPPDPRGERADVARVRAAQFSEERFAAATLAVYREAVELARSRL
jgi:glycosyltransferase involved in cell wall biosynthesis